MNIANSITLLRIFLVFITALLLYDPSIQMQLAAFITVIIVIALDWADGWVARSLKQETTFGGLFDIAGDRIVECVLWIVFADIGWVTIWVPLIFVTRGILTDFVRAIAFGHGKTPFGRKTLMQSSVGKFLSASRFMRAFYGILKSVVFSIVIIANSLTTLGVQENIASLILAITNILVIITVVLCILRAVPVLFEAKRFVQE